MLSLQVNALAEQMEFVLKSIQVPNFRSFTASIDKFYKNKVIIEPNETHIKPNIQSDGLPL